MGEPLGARAATTSLYYITLLHHFTTLLVRAATTSLLRTFGAPPGGTLVDAIHIFPFYFYFPPARATFLQGKSRTG